MKLRLEAAGRVLKLAIGKKPTTATPDDPTKKPPHELSTPMVTAHDPEQDPVGFRMPPW